MADQTTVDDTLLDYVRDISPPDDEILTELRELTAGLPGGRLMLLMPGQGHLLSLLARLVDARRILEIGTYTGYSTLCLARALPADGRIVTCDINPKWPDIGREFWERAGVEDRVDVRIGDAAETLAALRSEQDTPFDVAFVDADKAGYRNYYELALPLLRPGGLVVFDNTLFFGRVVDPTYQDPDTVGIREINALLREDDRVRICVLPVADGMTLAWKVR